MIGFFEKKENEEAYLFVNLHQFQISDGINQTEFVNAKEPLMQK